MISYFIDFIRQDAASFRKQLKQEWNSYSRVYQRRMVLGIFLIVLLGFLLGIAVSLFGAFYLVPLLPFEAFFSVFSDLYNIGTLFFIAGLFFFISFSLSLFRSILH